MHRRLLRVAAAAAAILCFTHCGSGICPIGGCPVPPAIGEGSFRILAGTFDVGLGGDAGAAAFPSRNHLKVWPDRGSLVVTAAGTVYFRDRGRGILTVGDDRVQRLLIPTTGKRSGDGGPVAQATLVEPGQLALDYSGGLLVYDYDRIRRIDLTATPPTIDTFLGGGSSTENDIAARELQFSPEAFGSYESPYVTATNRLFLTLVPLPNGDVWFQSDFDGIRTYHAATGKVTLLTPTGVGHSTSGTQDIALCRRTNINLAFYTEPLRVTSLLTKVEPHAAFPKCTAPSGTASLVPTTGVSVGAHPAEGPGSVYDVRFTGRDGRIYEINRFRGLLLRLDARSSVPVWEPVLGHQALNFSGQCLDGVAAASCDIDLDDAYVDELGKIYFMDRGRLRFVDESGMVRSLYGGGLRSGDNGKATEARLNVVNHLDVREDGGVVLLDFQEMLLREVGADGILRTIAGNGTNVPATPTGLAKTQGLATETASSAWEEFVLEPKSGDVFFWGARTTLQRLVRSTGRWTVLAGGGTTPYPAAGADGLPGTQLQFYYPPRILGFDGSRLLTLLQGYNGVLTDTLLKHYPLADMKQLPVGGVVGPSTLGPTAPGLCDDGKALSQCRLPIGFHTPYFYNRATWDAAGKRWLLAFSWTTAIRTLPEDGTIGTLRRVEEPLLSFAYHRQGDADIVHYCTGSGRLRASRGGKETELPLPEGVRCTGRALVYDAPRKRLVFPAVKQGLSVVAEYPVP